jgi:hypothetical protein
MNAVFEAQIASLVVLMASPSGPVGAVKEVVTAVLLD